MNMVRNISQMSVSKDDCFDQLEYEKEQVALLLLKPFGITSLEDTDTYISRDHLLSNDVSEYYESLFDTLRITYKKIEIRSLRPGQWLKDKKRTQNLLRQVLKSVDLKLVYSKKYVGMVQKKRQYAYQYQLRPIQIEEDDKPFD